ncbi:ATP-binding protein [Fictibacillus nanhaiensis]|uniref:AlbA family DNA-binding domain-containing protein n=1 Tax=Fictibacillus nanhaiensis TaxID=742169 RepID=UPI00203ED772|nr:ATP-binding protein [Fictibacillus nanhaiensis]MCM3732021.1 ATP-binding protein [Fictibacillus nanhaiensis]
MYNNIYSQDFLNTYDDKVKKFDVVTLQNLLDNVYGESNDLDFKEKLIKEDSIAKLCIAFANNGGGNVIFGVSDDNTPIGLNQEEIRDPTDFQRKLNSYLPNQLVVHHQVLSYKDDERYGDFSGKTFIIFNIPKQYRYSPFIAKKTSNNIDTGKIYIRKNTSIETATNDDLEKIFKLRLIEQFDSLSELDLKEHISQLKVLYKSINKTITVGSYWSQMLSPLDNMFGGSTQEIKNQFYPEEELDEFIANMIEKKKRKIEMVLEVSNIE